MLSQLFGRTLTPSPFPKKKVISKVVFKKINIENQNISDNSLEITLGIRIGCDLAPERGSITNPGFP